MTLWNEVIVQNPSHELVKHYSYSSIQLDFSSGVDCFAYNTFHVRYVFGACVELE